MNYSDRAVGFLASMDGLWLHKLTFHGDQKQEEGKKERKEKRGNKQLRRRIVSFNRRIGILRLSYSILEISPFGADYLTIFPPLLFAIQTQSCTLPPSWPTRLLNLIYSQAKEQ